MSFFDTAAGYSFFETAEQALRDISEEKARLTVLIQEQNILLQKQNNLIMELLEKREGS